MLRHFTSEHFAFILHAVCLGDFELSCSSFPFVTPIPVLDDNKNTLIGSLGNLAIRLLGTKVTVREWEGGKWGR